MNGKVLKRHATSILLVTAALGLGAYVWFVDRDKPTTEETEARKDNLLPVLRRDDITQIVIEHGGQKATIVRRDEGDAGDFMFYLVEGDADPMTSEADYADQMSVERLTQALEFATRLREMEGDFDRKAAGLEPPNTKLTLRMGAITYHIAIGAEAKTPAGARYAELEGQGVFVIPRAQADEMIRPIDAYRTRRIMPYSSSQLATIEVKNAQGTTHMERGSWGGFRVDNVPGKPRVSQVVFDRMLGAFANATAERFVEAAAAKEAVAGAKNTVELIFVSKKGERAELTLGGACPDKKGEGSSKLVVLIRKTPDPLYACVPSSVLTDLQMPAIAFAERRAFTVRPDEVEAIEVKRGDDTLELARKGSGWHVRKPEDQEIPGDDVAGYLHGLLSIEGTIVADPDANKLGLDPPRGAVTLTLPELGAKKLPPQVVQIGGQTESDTGPAIALRRKEDGVVLLVPRQVERLLQPTTTLIRSTDLLSVGAQRIQKIDVTWDDGKRQTLSRKGAGFELQRPDGYEVDTPLAADLFDAVSRLKAERWVADHDDGSFGLQKPFMRLAFAYKGDDGEQKRELLFGAPSAEGRYARWEPDTGVFILPRSLDLALRSWVIDRSGFMIDPNVVRSLTIRAGGRELRVVAKGDVWQTAGGSGEKLSPQALERIRQALIEMRPEGAVHLGAARPEEGMNDPLLRIEVDPLPETRRSKVFITIGRGDVWRTMNVYYARRKGSDATFAIAQSRVRPILDLVAPPEP